MRRGKQSGRMNMTAVTLIVNLREVYHLERCSSSKIKDKTGKKTEVKAKLVAETAIADCLLGPTTDDMGETVAS